jgi:hypothetical protein
MRDYHSFNKKTLEPSTSSKNSDNPEHQDKTKMEPVWAKHHRFIRSAEDDDDADDDWTKRVAKKYYDKLFKEYVLVHLGRYKQYQVATRWRTEKEVVSGKGQFSCGALDCSGSTTNGKDAEDEDLATSLTTWEVPFSYKEAGEHKEALVKCRLCPACSEKLLYARKKPKRDREIEPEADTSPGRKRKRDNSEKPTESPSNEELLFKGMFE